jgi:hypothetical protein
VTSASHDLALAWHPVLSSSSPLLSSFLSLDVTLHPNTELFTARFSALGSVTGVHETNRSESEVVLPKIREFKAMERRKEVRGDNMRGWSFFGGGDTGLHIVMLCEL